MKLQIEVPESLEDVRHELQVFFDAMVYKLEQNAHKGKWEDCDLEALMDRMDDECQELREAVANHSTTHILLESADCSNYAMMVSAVAIAGVNKRGDSND